MLLDRRRIRKWAKWVSLGLAIIFAVGFLFLGIGYGTGGANLSTMFSGGCSSATTVPDAAQGELDTYLAAIAANPNDTVAMRGAATIYEGMYRAGGDQGNSDLSDAGGQLSRAGHRGRPQPQRRLRGVGRRLHAIGLERGTSAGGNSAQQRPRRLSRRRRASISSWAPSRGLWGTSKWPPWLGRDTCCSIPTASMPLSSRLSWTNSSARPRPRRHPTTAHQALPPPPPTTTTAATTSTTG